MKPESSCLSRSSRATLAITLVFYCLDCNAEVKVDHVPTFTLSHQEQRGIELRVARLTPREALNRLAESLGFRWHDSGLPEIPISISCRGQNLESILDCLLGDKHSYLIHYAERERKQAEDVWLLSTAQPSDTLPEPSKLQEEAFVSQRQRANRLAHLVKNPAAEPGWIEEQLQRGLIDTSPLVRAQAVFGLTQREPDSVSGVLATGLADGDASVRLMAVENAGGGDTDKVLLQTALTDDDETVRTLAALKLEEMGQGQNQH